MSGNAISTKDIHINAFSICQRQMNSCTWNRGACPGCYDELSRTWNARKNTSEEVHDIIWFDQVICMREQHEQMYQMLLRDINNNAKIDFADMDERIWNFCKKIYVQHSRAEKFYEAYMALHSDPAFLDQNNGDRVKTRLEAFAQMRDQL